MASLYENYIVNDDWDYTVNYPGCGTISLAQTFTVGATGHTITSVKLKLYRYDTSLGTLSIYIRAVDGSGHPTGGNLTSGTMAITDITTNTAGAWYEITLTEYTLTANVQYAIVVNISGLVDGINWFADRSSPTYDGGNQERSTDSEATWISNTDRDQMFEVWGNALPISYIPKHGFIHLNNPAIV